MINYLFIMSFFIVKMNKGKCIFVHCDVNKMCKMPFLNMYARICLTKHDIYSLIIVQSNILHACKKTNERSSSRELDKKAKQTFD